MLKIYSGVSACRYSDVMEKIWRFRHEQFVERFGWEELREKDRREIDEFDTDKAIHLALFSGQRIVGYSRLLPTELPHLLSDVYPHLMEGRLWRREPKVYEWTRCVACAENTQINGVLASHLLMTGVMEFCLTAGIEALVVETHPKLVDLLISSGWDVTILNQPSKINGKTIVPIEARPSIMGLIQHHMLYSIVGSTLTFSSETANPLNPKTPLKTLSFLDDGPARILSSNAGLEAASI